MLLLSLMMAADVALYDPAPPADSAYVRVINAAPGQGVAVELAGQGLETLSYQQVSPYVVVKGGERPVSAGAAKANLSFDSGGFYTVVLESGTLTPLTDAPNDNLAKARISLYNLSAVTVSLKTADGSTTVFADVPPDGVKTIAVNAIPIELAVFVGEEALSLPPATLKAGMAYSVFVTGTDSPAAVLVTDSTKR